MQVLIRHHQLQIWHMLKKMYVHPAGYVDTHHRSGASASQTDKYDTGRSLSADKFSPATFFFYVSCAFYFTNGGLSGGSSSWICTSQLWHRQRPRPHCVSFSHEEWGFWWNAPPSSGLMEKYCGFTHCNLIHSRAKALAYVLVDTDSARKAKELNRCEIKGERIELEWNGYTLGGKTTWEDSPLKIDITSACLCIRVR